MNALSDPQLLRAYDERRSEAAFTELVRRHIDFVHSAAFRMVNDTHVAKDVTQGVFVALAKDAGKLARHPVLSGWLHRTARNIAAQSVRTEVRRTNREKLAAMNEHPESVTQWEEIAPHLDAALAELSGRDRDAVLLRYFENKPAQEMASILGISAEAAQKRVSRAVERLRESFSKRGLTAGAAGFASVISANAVQAAPAGLSASISTTAVAGAAHATKAIVVNTLRKAALGTAAATAIVFAIRQNVRVADLRAENLVLQQENATRPANASGSDEPFTVSGTAAASVTDSSGKSAGASVGTGGAGGFLLMASAGRSTDPSEYALFAPAGRGITTGAADAAGLEVDQRRAVDKILRNTWKRMEDDFASRAVAVSPEGNHDRAFSIPARTDGGTGPRRELETELDSAVGPEKRQILMAGLKARAFFGGFGSCGFRLEFNGDRCDFWMTDPKTGEEKSHGSFSREGFVDCFGNLFDLPPSESGPPSGR